MAAYDHYFLMSAADIPEYAYEKIPQIEWDRATMKASEIGDGNLNYVFRVYDGKGHSAIIKHAGEAIRINSDMHIETNRNERESEILMLEEKLCPGMVPHIYFYDTVMCACGMEDLSDHEMMRTAMLKHETFPHFAEDIAKFLFDTLIMTTDLVMDHQEKKRLVKKYTNPQLCDMTENLVLTEPYNDCNHLNHVYAPNAEFVQKQLYDDEALHLEVAKLKFNFMTNAQSLLHGDLHTGSIFIRQDSTKVFDPEFTFYGPMGYDIGNVAANLIFAWENGLSTNDEKFCDWCLNTVRDFLDLFIARYNEKYDSVVTERMAKTPGFKEWYLSTILRDTAGYTGTELHRRTVGMANVKDVTTIKDEKMRVLAERINILAGKNFIMSADQFRDGSSFVDAVMRAKEAAEWTL